MRTLAVALLTVATVCLMTQAIIGKTVVSVHFIDVGQGDAILIDYGQYELLIDGGPEGSTVAGYVERYVNGVLDVVVATHMDADHIGGLDEVFDDFVVQDLWVNGSSATTNVYDSFRTAYVAEGCVVHTARRAETIELGDLRLEILHPAALSAEENENSIVTALAVYGWSFLFTGDIDQSVENDLRLQGILPNADILKVAHHGSNASSASTFLEAISPRISVISVGATNQYGHPVVDVLNRIGCAAEGSWIFRTDVHGTVIISVDDEGKAYYTTEKGVDPIVAGCSSSAPPVQPPHTGFEIYRVEAVAECITLRNAGSEPADLGGWWISDGEGTDGAEASHETG